MTTEADPVGDATVTQPTRVLVVGQGYVGLPLAMASVAAGHDVTGFDVDERKVTGLMAGRSHIDDITDHDVAGALRTDRFRATDDPATIDSFDVAVITVPTPLREGAPDLSYVDQAAEMLGPLVQRDCTVILESTTYPGTTDERVAPVLEAHSGLKAGVDFHVGYSPERIDPGNETWTFTRTPKVVAGLTPESLAAVQSFYDELVERTVPVSSTRAAELTKLLENTYRHVNIALVNELAMHARALGIDIWEVIEAASSKPFGFTPFWPGPGVGGHCLPIDPSYLSWKIERQLGVTSRFVVMANDINNHMPAYVVQRVQLGLNQRRKAVNGARILVLGLAYKKNTSDARETPATGIIRGFVELGADVVAHDENAGAHETDVIATRVALTKDELRRVDAVVVVTDHDNVDYELVIAHAPYIFDARRRFSGENVEHL